MDTALLILVIYGQSSLQLNLEEGDTVHMLRDKIRAAPIIGEPNGRETIVCQHSGHFLKVVTLLLTRVQLLIVNSLQETCHRWRLWNQSFTASIILNTIQRLSSQGELNP